ncbi:MAG: serine/threonine-protein kinase [Polyangiales bacterium]
MRQGDRFENYVLTERLAEGGMADIFRARRVGSLDISREVCIKCIRPALSTDAEFVRMFVDEARIASTLRHSNIVAVDHFGTFEGALFMCSEWVHGVDARRLLTRLAELGRAMPVDAALFVVSEVLKALEYAHGKIDGGAWLQIVHRDVSPHNVMISYSGDVKLTDFGIARATSRLHQTRGDMIKGKLAYMAPEQASGDLLDHRADLFAVGVVAYELLTGRRPFKGESDIDGVQRMLRGERVAISTHRADVSPEVERFVDTLMAISPDERFIDAGVALDELGQLPSVASGARSLQRLLREVYADVPFSTLPPRLASTLVPQSPVAASNVVRGSDSTELARPVARPAAVPASTEISYKPRALRGPVPVSVRRPVTIAEGAAAKRVSVDAQTQTELLPRGGRVFPFVAGVAVALSVVAIASLFVPHATGVSMHQTVGAVSLASAHGGRDGGAPPRQ